MDKVRELVNTLDGRVKYELETPVEIEECSDFPDVNSLPLDPCP
jgi:hypothetical protein